jgi:hypothetical protein
MECYFCCSYKKWPGGVPGPPGAGLGMRGPTLAARTIAVGDRKFVILDNFGNVKKTTHFCCHWTLTPTVPSLPAIIKTKPMSATHRKDRLRERKGGSVSWRGGWDNSSDNKKLVVLITLSFSLHCKEGPIYVFYTASFPTSTFMYLWVIYIFPRWVLLFSAAK